MTYAIYTTELMQANAHLMPWRTVLEVAAQWQAKACAVLILSGDRQSGDEVISGIRVAHVPRPKGAAESSRFCARLAAEGVGRLFFPIAPGSLYVRLVRQLGHARVALTWYYPGAWYTPGQVLRAATVMNRNALLPYALQALVPKRLWLRGLRALGARPVITMTPLTAGRLRAAGYPADRVLDIPPGRAPVARSGIPSEECAEIERAVSGSRFFLFFGPPNPIRGVYHLLEAFAQVSRTHRDARLVCLFRGDGNVDSTAVRERIAQLGFGDRLLAVWHSVGPADLDLLLKQCFAVLKPFVIVPSEIPLAVIETAEYGKPVVGFQGDGTGAFIAQFGVLAKHSDSGDLAGAMRRLLDDQTLYDERCQTARCVYAAHPGWEEVADRWARIGELSCSAERSVDSGSAT